MIRPLMILAIPSVLGGLMGFSGIFTRFFEPGAAESAGGFAAALTAPFSEPAPALFGLLAIIAGFSTAATCYWNTARDPLPDMLGGLARAARNRFYFDELYETLIALTQDAFAALANAFDKWIIAGLLVRGAHGTTELAGRALRLAQTGNLNTYAFMLVAGAAALLYLVLFR
jgi:NADH-quinone oxidoreductase subunit L